MKKDLLVIKEANILIREWHRENL